MASLTGHDDIIDLGGLVTRGVHEPELSLVIARRGKNIPESRALDHVFGYMVCNDVSARGLTIEGLGTLRNRVVANVSAESDGSR